MHPLKCEAKDHLSVLTDVMHHFDNAIPLRT